jgi:hypothetical protein
MTTLARLFSDKDISNTLNSLGTNLDKAIAKGSPQEDVLLIMKNLLDDIKVCNSITEYIEEEPYESTMDIYRRENINR